MFDFFFDWHGRTLTFGAFCAGIVRAIGKRGHHLAFALATFGGVWHCERQNMERGAPA